ncbi:hypothetical protein [Afipia clevelandensis]|uniref:GIY-YIG domain-containing protein n=1 Tax=Afipia clevelandensis ATCC 49720 TaxID=883079 RepID=K8PHL1_9BRAD|nr:hypothetical protein [Afipia clevelandensis]EKS40244.1 hypothetical protein HMPREF9696_00695 [Afipia clevelandensis ATCC 49720]
MTISEDIRSLAQQGLGVAEIARRVGTRYQHVYGVLRDAGLLEGRRQERGTLSVPVAVKPLKAALTRDVLLSSGFASSDNWTLSRDGEIVSNASLPKHVGVYAFVRADAVLYVGVATMGLAKRLYFYRKPGATQITSLRINALIKEELTRISAIEVLTASPEDTEWNGLPVHGSAGLELGLIKKFDLPWNVRSAR